MMHLRRNTARAACLALLMLAGASAGAGPGPADFRLAPHEIYSPFDYCGDDCEPSYNLDAAWVGDLTGDGRDDLLTAPVTNEIWVIPQRADGTLAFDAKRVFAYGDTSTIHTKHFVLGDFNEDGALDMAGNVAGQGLAMNLLLSDGGGGHHLVELPMRQEFANEWQYPAASDVDGDGHLDVVVFALVRDGDPWDHTAPFATFAYVQFGDGAGAFPRIERFKVNDLQAKRAELGDLDGDGDDDMVLCTVSSGESRLAVSFNDGPGHFGQAEPTGDGCTDFMKLADFDGDGRDDVNVPGGATGARALSFPAPGENAYAPLPDVVGNPFPYTLLNPDLNRDGRPDLFMTQFVCDGMCSWIFATPYLNLKTGWTGIAGPVPPDESSRVPGNGAHHRHAFAAGDLDSDGCTDVVSAHSSDGLAIHYGMHCVPPPPANDFDADGRSGILWRHAGNGSNAIWRAGRRDDPRHVRAVRNTDWEVVATGDFDGDRADDLFWRNRSTGANALWPAAAPSSTPVQGVTRAGWRVAGIGDFDGDGRDDLFWRNEVTGANAVWPSGHPGNVSTVGVRDLDWAVVGVGDFDGDRKADVLWRHAGNGRNAIWRGGHYRDQQAVRGVSNTAWVVAGVGDFDSDGTDDILWRNAATGANVAWRGADGGDTLPVTDVGNLAWGVAAIGDYDGDGRADILWRNARTGANVIWRAADYGAQVGVARVRDLEWQVVPSP